VSTPTTDGAVRVLPSGAALYDAARLDSPGYSSFDPGWWEAEGRMLGPAGEGRGSVFFLRPGAPDEHEQWALRHYHRGGLVGRVVDDRFLWSGAERTRSFREWRLLNRLRRMGLPVPIPVAACFRREGRTYAADLITVRIPDARPLSEWLRTAPLDSATWRRIGRCIREFHDAGVFHADLNGHNLLLDRNRQPWLLDFDRGRIRPDGGWRRSNLSRFLRSLNKIASEDSAVRFGRTEWAHVLAGYAVDG
jgi:3-deoxy-D-manno-octulosonic acid kinase